ncbi:hypothetical protein F5888DRAFT_1808661 [Russula emetica]|nr:hypothetical protein F5888DRAFT_1808661 [Russula emetica]
MTVIALFPSSSHFIFEKFAPPPWLEEEFVDLMAGAAGVISSVEDLVLWNRMYLNGGVDPKTNATIISPAQLNAIMETVLRSPPLQRFQP